MERPCIYRSYINDYCINLIIDHTNSPNKATLKKSEVSTRFSGEIICFLCTYFLKGNNPSNRPNDVHWLSLGWMDAPSPLLSPPIVVCVKYYSFPWMFAEIFFLYLNSLSHSMLMNRVLFISLQESKQPLRCASMGRWTIFNLNIDTLRHLINAVLSALLRGKLFYVSVKEKRAATGHLFPNHHTIIISF